MFTNSSAFRSRENRGIKKTAATLANPASFRLIPRNPVSFLSSPHAVLWKVQSKMLHGLNLSLEPLKFIFISRILIVDNISLTLTGYLLAFRTAPLLVAQFFFPFSQMCVVGHMYTGYMQAEFFA